MGEIRTLCGWIAASRHIISMRKAMKRRAKNQVFSPTI